MIDQCYHAPSDVLEAYCRVTGVALNELCGPSKTRPITQRRHEAMYLLRYLTSQSMAGIGNLLGGRDLATVHAGIANVADAITTNQMTADRIRHIARMIRQRLEGLRPIETPAAITRAAVVGVLSDATITDADARIAALQLLGVNPVEVPRVA